MPTDVQRRVLATNVETEDFLGVFLMEVLNKRLSKVARHPRTDLSATESDPTALVCKLAIVKGKTIRCMFVI